MELIADTVIDLLYRGSARQADPELLEAACSQAIVRGDTALRELVQEESTLPAEWDYIRNFRHCTMQLVPENDNIYRSLRRLLLD